MTEKIRREAAEQTVGTVQTADTAGRSAAVEAVEGRADTEKKLAEAMALRTADRKAATEAMAQNIAAKSAGRMHVRKEQSPPGMRREANSRRTAVS